ncbi:MAG: 50S ribosomal protein L28 [Thermoanaerobaculia bacterium]|nr:50S ribosomal protein L28 [Thermoanaerobaculia bacterium]
MSKVCAYCGKGTVVGRSVSHAHRVTARPMRANLQRIRVVLDGAIRKVWVCTRCIRSGRVEKPATRQWSPDEA